MSNSRPESTPPPPVDHDYVPTNKHSKVLLVCLIIVAMGGYLFKQYLDKITLDAKRMEGRPPMLTAIKDNIKATEMSGKEVDIGQLEGKVWVVGFIATQSPRGDAGVAEEMKKLQSSHGANSKFHLVTITVDAERDTPEKLREWTTQKGYQGDNWWFLTGDGPKLRAYMKERVKLLISEVPVAERKNEFDLWQHKFALVLVDHKLRIRGAYDFSNPEMADLYRKQMNKDLERVLKEADDPTLAD